MSTFVERVYGTGFGTILQKSRNAELINGFLSAYGVENLDQEKLNFYAHLDELF